MQCKHTIQTIFLYWNNLPRETRYFEKCFFDVVVITSFLHVIQTDMFTTHFKKIFLVSKSWLICDNMIRILKKLVSWRLFGRVGDTSWLSKDREGEFRKKDRAYAYCSMKARKSRLTNALYTDVFIWAFLFLHSLRSKYGFLPTPLYKIQNKESRFRKIRKQYTKMYCSIHLWISGYSFWTASIHILKVGPKFSDSRHPLPNNDISRK